MPDNIHDGQPIDQSNDDNNCTRSSRQPLKSEHTGIRWRAE